MSGWGAYPYGTSPWGTSTSAAPGDFNICCFFGTDMYDILTDADVTTAGSGLHFVPNPGSLDMEVCGGGLFPLDNAVIYITKPIPQDFTAEWVVDFANLPNDFTDIVNKHIYLGATDAAGPLVGLFFSKVGVAYTGSVSFDGLGNIQLDTAFQQIPGSSAYISEGEYWHVRVAASYSVGVVYLYMTKLTELGTTGHQLRAILPVIPYTAAANPPTDQLMVSVRGTATEQVCVFLDRLCAADHVIIPNLAPVANAGEDRADRTCSIVQLNGSQSFDPEGAALSYFWRLSEAPSTSEAAITKDDGATYPLPVPTGFTSLFHSTELGVVDALDPVAVGDALRFSGEVYSIVGKGIDGNGFYVQVVAEVLPDGLVSTPFKVLRQRGVSGATTVSPTFYPDVPGFYSFDLIVSDGDLFSDTSSVVINILESPLPRGCTPSLAFIFEYLSDFWQLVEDKDRISTFWSSLAQVAATELYTLWQIEYSKSLRDIQRTFVRRWLHYDLLLGEPLSELTTHRLVFGGVESLPFAAGAGGWSMASVEVTSDVLSEPGVVVIKVGNTETPETFAAYLQGRLQATVDERFTTHVFQDRTTLEYIVRIDAPFPFTVGSGTTWTNLTIGAEGRPPSGSGAVTGTKTYKTDRSLEGLDIKEDDFLVVGGAAYRISSVADSLGDTYPYQRVVVKEELPIAPGTGWVISGWVQSELLDFYEGLVDQDDYVDFEVSEVSNETAPTSAVYGFLEVRALGVNEAQPSRLAVDQWGIGAAVAQSAFNVYLARVLRRHYVPVDALVVDIPLLQADVVLEDNEAALRRNLDFYVEEVRGHNALRFACGLGSDPGDVWEGERPPNRLWAEYTYLDNSPTIEDNFGIAVDLTADQIEELPSNVDYLSAVRGLFYAFYNGPAIRNLRIGSQILLGLPFAEEQGTIEEIRRDFSTTTGRLLVRDAANEQLVRSYSFPRELELETNPATGELYTIGDTVEQFAPLVEGVLISDWIKNPRWFEGMLNQGIFFEVEKFHQFLVMIDEAAFDLETLLFVKNFILKIKPTYTFPRFIVRKNVEDTEISVTDNISYAGRLSLYDSLCPALFGVAGMYDQARPAGGGWRNQFDTDTDPSTSPTYPTAQTPVGWGYDKIFFCPFDEVTLDVCETFLASFTIPFDSVFAYDEPVSGQMIFEDTTPSPIPASPGYAITPSGDNVADVNGTLSKLRVWFLGTPGTDPTDYEVVVFVNGTPQATEAFTCGTNTEILRTISVSVLVGDVVTVAVQAASGGARTPSWSYIKAAVTQQDAAVWSYGDTLTAGTYCLERTLS